MAGIEQSSQKVQKMDSEVATTEKNLLAQNIIDTSNKILNLFTQAKKNLTELLQSLALPGLMVIYLHTAKIINRQENTPGPYSLFGCIPPAR